MLHKETSFCQHNSWTILHRLWNIDQLLRTTKVRTSYSSTHIGTHTIPSCARHAFWSVVSLSASFTQGAEVIMYKISVVLATLVAIIYCEPSFNFNIYTRNSHRSSYAYPESSRSRSFPLSVIEAVPSVIRTVVERVSTPLRRSNNNRRIDSRPVYYSNYPEYYKSVTSKPKSTTLKSYGFKLFELPKLTPKTVPVSEPSNVIEKVSIIWSS